MKQVVCVKCGVSLANDVNKFNSSSPLNEISTKWYNDKIKLSLSLLFFPILLYGIYKTSLIKKRTKYFVYGIFLLFIVFSSPSKNSGGMGSGSVRQSSWDNSVDCVESYLKNRYLKDPDSYEGIKWTKVQSNSDGTYEVTHTFRAKNGFGGMEQETMTFTIASDGWTIINAR